MTHRGLIYLAIRNIKRRRFRTIVISLAMAVIIGTLFTTQVFVQGVASAVEVGANSDEYDP